MTKRAITRRQFGAGAATALIATAVPLPALATLPFDPTHLSADLKYGVDVLIEAHREFQRAEHHYGQRGYGPLMWGDYYGDLLEAHHDLVEYLTDDNAETAAKVTAWANTLVHPVCAQARAFWTPPTELSPNFAQLHPDLIEARKVYALARYRYWSGFPSGHWLHDSDMESFEVRLRVMERAADAWFARRHKIRIARARTSGDRELARRVVETMVTDDSIDVPYLKTVIADWRPHDTWPELRRCPLPCAACQSLFESATTARPA